MGFGWVDELTKREKGLMDELAARGKARSSAVVRNLGHAENKVKKFCVS